MRVLNTILSEVPGTCPKHSFFRTDTGMKGCYVLNRSDSFRGKPARKR